MTSDKELIAKQARLERIKREARAQADRDRPSPELIVRYASDITPDKLVTVFGGRFIRGAFQLMVGPGEVGKGMCSADIIARLSTGEPFPNESKGREPVITIVCVTEDTSSRVVSRLIAAGANLKKIIFIDGPPAMRGGLIVPSPVAFDNDAGSLVTRAAELRASALFLETTVEHLGDREHKTQWSTNNEAEVRRALAPIVAVCKLANLIGWGVMHPRKSQEGGIEDSISGSAAFRNVGRSVLNVFKDPTDQDQNNPWRLLVCSKANYLAQRPSTLRFRIEKWDRDPTEGRVVWGIAGRNLIDDRSAEDVWRQIQESNRKRRDYVIQDAEKLLRKFLAGGAKKLEDVKAMAEEEGVSWRAIQKAKENIGVESLKEGFPGVVKQWRLPADDKEDM